MIHVSIQKCSLALQNYDELSLMENIINGKYYQWKILLLENIINGELSKGLANLHRSYIRRSVRHL